MKQQKTQEMRMKRPTASLLKVISEIYFFFNEIPPAVWKLLIIMAKPREHKQEHPG